MSDLSNILWQYGIEFETLVQVGTDLGTEQYQNRDPHPIETNEEISDSQMSLDPQITTTLSNNRNVITPEYIKGIMSTLIGKYYRPRNLRGSKPYNAPGRLEIRRILANLYNKSKLNNNLVRKYCFSYHQGYKGKIILDKSTPNESATCDSKQRNWVVSHDGSVRLLQQNGRVCNFYETLDILKTAEQKPVDREYNTARGKSKYFRTPYVFENIEIVTGILEDSDISNLGNIFNVLTVNNNLQYFNNSTTSQHVHMSAKVANSRELFREPNNLLKICLAWWYFEPIILKLYPSWRKDNNEFCRPMREKMAYRLTPDNVEDFIKLLPYAIVRDSNFNPIIPLPNLEDKQKFALLQIIAVFQGDPFDRATRYAAFNLMNLKSKVDRVLVPGTSDDDDNKDGIGTIEIRLKHGSNDMIELTRYITFYKYFMDIAMRNPMLSTKAIIEALQQGASRNTQISDLLSSSSIPNLLGTNAELVQLFKELIYFLTGNEESNHLVRIMITSLFNDQLIKIDAAENTGLTVPDTLNVDNLSQERIPILLSKKMDGLSIQDPYRLEGQPSVGGGRGHRGGDGGSGYLPFDKCKKRVFCYGSNGIKQIEERTGARDLVAYPAYMPNMVRIFAGYSKRWNGGVAGLYPKDGERCYGTVLELSERELERLDAYEGGYTREKKYAYITLPDGSEIKMMCDVYIKTNVRFTHLPSLDYLHAIRIQLDGAGRTDGSRGILVRGVHHKENPNTGKVTRYLKVVGIYDNGVYHSFGTGFSPKPPSPLPRPKSGQSKQRRSSASTVPSPPRKKSASPIPPVTKGKRIRKMSAPI